MFVCSENNLYLCIRISEEVRALSSVGSERLPYKQRVGGSNPSAPTNLRITKLRRGNICGLFFCFHSIQAFKTFSTFKTGLIMKHPIRHYLSKFKYIIALVIFIVSIGFIGEHSITERLKRKQEIATLQGKIAEQQRKFEEDNRILEELKSDPDAVRRVAREKYFMKRSNEDVFIIEDE